MQSDLLARARKLEGYAAQDPGNLSLLRDLAQTYHRAGEHQRALDVLDGSPDVAEAPAPWAALRGQLLLALGRWDDAARLFEKALQQQPDSSALLFNLGYATWASDSDPDLAIERLSRAAQAEPTNARFRHQLALALESAGDVDAAMQALRETLAIEPDHADALFTLGRLELDAGAFDEASASAARCIAAHPARATGWLLKGQIALFQMDAAAAAKSLRQALDLDPDDVDTRVSLAQASLMQGRPRHARALLEEAVAKDPADDAAQCMLGWACIADNDAQAAGAAFARAHALAPQNADALAGSACIRLSEGQTRPALQLAEQALTLDRGHVIAQMIVARAHELDGQAVQAKELFGSVLQSSPFGPLRSKLGEALEAGARSPAARRLNRRFARGVATAPAGRGH